MRRLFSTLLLVALAACGSDDIDDPEAAQAFLGQLQKDNYRGWSRPEGWGARQKSIAAHGDEADIYVNATLAATQTGATSWPVGSILVKDSFRGGDLRLIAAMEKRQEGWYYAEWSGDGELKFAGRPGICTDCHNNGSDEVLSSGLPR